MKILGYEVVKVIKGKDIFKEHFESEFAVNDTEMIYDVRGLIRDYTTGEIDSGTFYLINDMREIEKTKGDL